MVLGSFFATASLLPSIYKGLKTGFGAVYLMGVQIFAFCVPSSQTRFHRLKGGPIPRTEKDIPFPYIVILGAILFIPIVILFYFHVSHLGVAVFMTLFVVVLGFMFSACSGLLGLLFVTSHYS
jgi:uncharacterized oligopeptide transporter (OPT) family protein